MKKIFFADSMMATPFQEGPRREQLNFPEDVRIVDAADDADVIIGRFHYSFNDYFDLNRQYYMWTHEPAWCSVAEPQFVDAATGQTIHVSTPWNGDVYLNPLFFFPFYRLKVDEILDLARQKTKPCVVVATYRLKFDRYQGAVNVDLTEQRQRLAIGLHRDHDYCDIFGKSWPDTVKIQGESRGAGWHKTKQEILRDYAFNLTFENTQLHNYVTEKLWDAYISASVPLYYGHGSGVDAVLSDASYIDCSHLKSVGELYDRLSSMSLDDRLDILRSALADIEKITKSTTRQEVLDATVNRFFERIRGI